MTQNVTVPRCQALFVWERGIYFAAFAALADWAAAFRTILGQRGDVPYHADLTVNPPDLTTPSQILPRIADGEAGAMDLCIARYGGLVWSIARRYLKESSAAEDLVQEVFTEIWKKAGAYDPAVASEITYVGLIARRRAIDFLRRHGRQPGFEPLSAAESLPHPVSETSSVDCDPEAIQTSLAKLPDETRRLFGLFFEDGFTHPEIAERTGLPLGTVKTRLRRGLIALREQLQRVGITSHPTAS